MLVVSALGYWIFMSDGIKDRAVAKASAQTVAFLNINFPPLTSCAEGLDISQSKSPVLQFCKRYSSKAPQKQFFCGGIHQSYL